MTATVQDIVALARVRQLAASGKARAIRQKAALSSAEVAGAVGVSHVSILAWETGKRAPRGEAALRYGALIEQLHAAIGGTVW